MGSARDRSTPMLWSAALHVAVVVAALLYPAPLPEIPPVPPPFARVSLAEPPKLHDAPPAPQLRARARLAPPRPKLGQPAPRQVPIEQAPRIETETQPVVALPLESPSVETPQPAGPALVAATASAPRPEPAAVRAAGFEGADVQASGPAHEARVNVGSFEGASGSPGGSPGAGRKAEVRRAGFGGALTSSAAGKPGPTVASGGFGGAVARGVSSGTPAEIASAGFGEVRGERAAVLLERVDAEPDLEPVEILSKPRPAYSAEARERRIEGEVALQARFGADGRIEVLRVLRGLGHGLDEAAARAVEAMRFRPARRGGEPVDVVLSVAVAFRLAY